MFKIRDDLESFWYFATAIPGENLAYLTVDPFNFRVIQRFLVNFFEFFFEEILPVRVCVVVVESE